MIGKGRLCAPESILHLYDPSCNPYQPNKRPSIQGLSRRPVRLDGVLPQMVPVRTPHTAYVPRDYGWYRIGDDDTPFQMPGLYIPMKVDIALC